MSTPEGLPELPPSSPNFYWDGTTVAAYPLSSGDLTHYTADQMRAYGLACYQAALERAAGICDRLEYPGDDEAALPYNSACEDCAAAIRSAKP